jgi:type IV pilus assembly protein PilA
MRRTRGFSLIELLIVIAVLLILAALTVPNLLRSKMNANEASAVSSMRAINTAQAAYAIAFPLEGYSDALAKLGPPPAGDPVSDTAAGFLDPVLACASEPCFKAGYNFQVINPEGDPVVSYELTGVPQVVGRSGRRGFCSDKTRVIRVDPNGGTSCTAPLQ